MVKIVIQNGNRCELDGSLKVLTKLYNEFKIKHPNAWHIQMYQKGRNRWDGYIKYVSESGTFRIGLLPKIYNTLIGYGEKVQIIDRRLGVKDLSPVIPKYLGDKELYPRQVKALETLLNNKVGNIPFLICAGDYSVGFGKSLLFCAIHEAFQRKIPTILLLNDSDLFNQFKREIPPLLPDEDIAFIQGGKVNSWGNFNVAMVQSLSRNISYYQRFLSNIGIVLIDEADIIDNKTYKTVIEHLYNSFIRIGLSGTIYMSNLKKDLVHNMNIMSFIGDKVDTVKLIDQMKAGRATPVVVKMLFPKGKAIPAESYPEEYEKNITKNPDAYERSFSRTLYNAKYDRFPMLIVTKFIEHCESLYKYYEKRNKELGLGYRISYVHHKTKTRDQILNDFREGKIDILISTTIISRGKNFPTMKYLQNTASMDSNEKSIQILGRLVRQHASKKKAYLDDLIFPGHYLSRHGKHRKVYYQKEKLKVICIGEKISTNRKLNKTREKL